MKDIQGFIDWVKAKPGKRHVQIDIKYVVGKLECRTWVYDYDLMEGQRVNDASEIDLEKILADREKAEYEKLKKKFEGAR